MDFPYIEPGKPSRLVSTWVFGWIFGEKPWGGVGEVGWGGNLGGPFSKFSCHGFRWKSGTNSLVRYSCHEKTPCVQKGLNFHYFSYGCFQK